MAHSRQHHLLGRKPTWLNLTAQLSRWRLVTQPIVVGSSPAAAAEILNTHDTAFSGMYVTASFLLLFGCIRPCEIWLGRCIYKRWLWYFILDEEKKFLIYTTIEIWPICLPFSLISPFVESNNFLNILTQLPKYIRPKVTQSNGLLKKPNYECQFL